jgi:hypothetical protein
MPPLLSHNSNTHHESFTFALREKLLVNRSILTEWAEHEKEHIDVLAEQHRATVVEQQAVLDAAATQYLALQLQQNCHITVSLDNGEDDTVVPPSTTTTDGKHRSLDDLTQEAARVATEITDLQRQLSDKHSEIQGREMGWIRESRGRALITFDMLMPWYFTHSFVTSDRRLSRIIK